MQEAIDDHKLLSRNIMRNHIRENIEHSLERKLDPFKEIYLK